MFVQEKIIAQDLKKNGCYELSVKEEITRNGELVEKLMKAKKKKTKWKKRDLKNTNRDK